MEATLNKTNGKIPKVSDVVAHRNTQLYSRLMQ